MDRFRKFDKYGYGILDDPSLKTTADEFKFKYIPKEQFQKVIKMVEKDRTKQKKTWADNPQLPDMNARDYHVNTIRMRRNSRSFNKHTVKTEKSTVKILTHPMVEKSSPYSTQLKSPRRKKEFVVPKIRIMTDAEIQKVVENAVKEIMDKEDTRHEVTARLTPQNYDEITTLYSPNLDLQSIFNEPSKDDISSRRSLSEFSDTLKQTNTNNEYDNDDPQKKLSQRSYGGDNTQTNILESISKTSLTTPKDLNVSVKRAITPRWLELENDADDEKISVEDAEDAEDVEDEDNVPETMRKSYKSVSVHSFSSSSTQSISLQSKEDIPENQEDEHSIKIKNDLSKATLTSFERKELETLLGVKAIVKNTEIDLDSSTDSKSSSEDEFEEENEKEINTNIFPVVEIRQPVRKMAESETEVDEKDKISVVRIPREYDSDFDLLREEGGQEKTDRFRLKDGSRNASSLCTPRKNSLQSSRQLSNTECLPPKCIVPKSAMMPKVYKTRKVTKPPQQDVSPYKVNEMNEEKLMIFSKITSYQEKIIGLLDQLRINLLNLSLPDGQPDRIRRENQVIEFTARFSRNYLYQLERMIKDLQLMSKEQYLSRHSNEHRTKICVIYGILYQATQSYLKQIKYFLMEQTPRKLDVLIEYIINATNICINKNVFDKKDKVVWCLLERCNSMLGFLEDLKDQRKSGATSDRSIKNVKPKFTSKWEAPVKNKLSMYEPSIMSASRKRKVIKKKKTKSDDTKCENGEPTKTYSDIKTCFSNEDNVGNIDAKKSNIGLNDSSLNLCTNGFQDIEKDILTQMEKISKESASALSPLNMMSSEDLSIDCFDSPRSKTEDDESEMKARVYEALQSITKQQVHQMLGPLVCNLGCILNKNTSARDLETLLSDLKSGNSQVVKKATLTGNGTFNREYDTEAHNCEDSKSFGGEHALSSEHRLDLSQSKQCARALLNRRLSSQSGEYDDVVVTTSQLTVELAAPTTNCMELANIAEEPHNSPEEGEGGAVDQPLSTNPSSTKVQQLRYDKNIQFTFVSSENDFVVPENEEQKIVNMEFKLPLEDLSDQEAFDNDKFDSKPELSDDIEEQRGSELPEEEYLDGILGDRLNFIRQIANNPLYVNEFFSQPWKVVSRLTKKIVDQAVNEVENEISFGEESYLEDFLKMEMGL